MAVPEKEKRQFDTVLVDVYPWVKAIEENPLSTRIPLNGVFRHAQTLCKYFSPALGLVGGETVSAEACFRLEEFLKKPIHWGRAGSDEDLVTDIHAYGATHWISIAPDCAGPAAMISRDRREYKTISILHDTFALDGEYSDRNRQNYQGSIKFTDCLAPVSKTALDMFQKRPISKEFEGQIVNYSPAHRFYRMPKESTFAAPRTSVSIGTLYPYKNLTGLLAASDWYTTKHYHIGKFDMADEVRVTEALDSGHFVFTGEFSDRAVNRLLAKASYFFCLSIHEGFSMTPMEAIISGVPKIILSDIPAHREIYCHSGALFLNPMDVKKSLRKAGSAQVISKEMRKRYFDEYREDYVMRDLISYVEGQLS